MFKNFSELLDQRFNTNRAIIKSIIKSLTLIPGYNF